MLQNYILYIHILTFFCFSVNFWLIIAGQSDLFKKNQSWALVVLRIFYIFYSGLEVGEVRVHLVKFFYAF